MHPTPLDNIASNWKVEQGILIHEYAKHSTRVLFCDKSKNWISWEKAWKQQWTELRTANPKLPWWCHFVCSNSRRSVQYISYTWIEFSVCIKRKILLLFLFVIRNNFGLEKWVDFDWDETDIPLFWRNWTPKCMKSWFDLMSLWKFEHADVVLW